MNRRDNYYDPKLIRDFFERYYQDRGMVKWQGYYLSDHTSALNKEAAAKAKYYPAKPKQTPEVISARLEKAFANEFTVSIQLVIHDSSGNFQPDIVGHVLGYNQSLLYLTDSQFIHLAEIRHIDLLAQSN